MIEKTKEGDSLFITKQQGIYASSGLGNLLDIVDMLTPP
jgi:hypothetical protein